jgi:hypothetical protein
VLGLRQVPLMRTDAMINSPESIFHRIATSCGRET